MTEHKTTGNTKTHIQRFELIRPGQFYFDACYNPSKTAFLKNAEKKGCKILNGLGMSSSRGLLRSNYGPDRSVMRKELKEIIREENEKAQTV